MAQTSEFRNLIHLSKITSSPRVLNLNLITDNLKKDKKEELHTFFKHNVLNQLIIIKHRLRPGEEDYFSSHRYSATKIFLPYSPEDLRDGGKFAFLGENDIARKMQYEFNVDLDNNSEENTTDIRLLGILERLPSLDPFLLKTAIERLKLDSPHLEIDIDQGYFQIGHGDYEKIRSFVIREFIPLAEAAFGKDEQTPDRARQISDKMWEGTDTSFLAPICSLLGISDDAVTDILFSWKGVLYYKFIGLTIEERMMKMLKGMRTMVTTGHQTLEEKKVVEDMRNDLISAFIEMMDIIKKQINTYNNIYQNEFIKNKNGSALKSLLERAPQMFGSLGASIGSVSHACSYWEYRYANDLIRRCNADDFTAMMEDFADGITTAKEFAA
jgi:hypothetical protein